jgi:hypothetical protein
VEEPVIDLENLTALVAATYNLNTVGERVAMASERSHERARLAIEIEERALELIRQARATSGAPDDQVLYLPADDEPEDAEEQRPEIELDGPFNPAKVRDAMVKFKGGFLIPELAAALGAPISEVKKWVLVWARGGHLEETGFKVGRDKQYRYVPPTPKPVQRPKVPPPEVTVNGAGSQRQATGEPVRQGALAKLGRERSQPGLAHRARQRDKRFERTQAAKGQRQS